MSAATYCSQCQQTHEAYYGCDPKDLELAALRALTAEMVRIIRDAETYLYLGDKDIAQWLKQATKVIAP